MDPHSPAEVTIRKGVHVTHLLCGVSHVSRVARQILSLCAQRQVAQLVPLSEHVVAHGKVDDGR